MHSHPFVRLGLALAATWVGTCVLPAQSLPTPREMADATRDLWGEAAVRHPGGPSYEFFKDLLPPLRYANTAFRHYPIVLGTPAGTWKPRFISNGSAINARADKKPMWRELGFPVSFHVGDAGEPFGDALDRLDGPRYASGFLPIVLLAYRHGSSFCEQEVFAPTEGPLAEHGAVLVRFGIRGAATQVIARVATAAGAGPAAIRDASGKGLVLFGPGWQWNAEARELRAWLTPGNAAVLAVLTKPIPEPYPQFDEPYYDVALRTCLNTWQGILAQGTPMVVPEKIVDDARQSLIVGNFLIAIGDHMNYSAGNAYDHLYEGECGDAVRSLLLHGHTKTARAMVGPLLDFYRKATRYHVAGHKLQLLNHYYWVTRDADYLREKEPVWSDVVRFILESREAKTGLLPPDNYAGDIPQQVYSLNSNANCWRGLRDLAAVLDDMGEREKAGTLMKEAAGFREAILAAVSKSEFKDAKPPFIPNALFGVEAPYPVLTATKLGSYYDLMSPYIIGSGVFAPGSERETWMIDYLRQHGGIAMGMIRSMPHQGEFDKQPGVNVLYGLRYMLALLRRDDRDAALTGFYGQLAQAMTRDTFIGGEGSRFFHGDAQGRSFYLPPNSASNAMFLVTLRYLLVQDWDLDDDGKPDTLRLLYGAPGRWLEDGAKIRIERAPTMFGPVSLVAESKLREGTVHVRVTPPPHAPAKLLVRPTLPTNWRVTRAVLNDEDLPVAANGAIDATGQRGPFVVRFDVRQENR